MDDKTIIKCSHPSGIIKTYLAPTMRFGATYFRSVPCDSKYQLIAYVALFSLNFNVSTTKEVCF